MSESTFIQITANNDGLYALDAEGGVWTYYPAREAHDRYAFWGRLTTHRANPERKKVGRGSDV